jgi:hypothetical protein
METEYVSTSRVVGALGTTNAYLRIGAWFVGEIAYTASGAPRIRPPT